jgi:hypothetical protein
MSRRKAVKLSPDRFSIAPAFTVFTFSDIST